MIKIAVEYTEPGVVEDTGLIYEALAHTKVMECSSLIALPEMLTVKDPMGKACSFFYDTMTALTIGEGDEAIEITKFTMKDIVEALDPSADAEGGNG